MGATVGTEAAGADDVEVGVASGEAELGVVMEVTEVADWGGYGGRGQKRGDGSVRGGVGRGGIESGEGAVMRGLAMWTSGRRWGGGGGVGDEGVARLTAAWGDEGVKEDGGSGIMRKLAKSSGRALLRSL
ncbi:glycine-rich cell wall structural protein 1.0-like [Setaria italica]|uniref:glycine-rich cell wall structural protein 1.0-like n=1 Tax=Setaria italica TaxID=4555 RepID=UPI000646B4FD|nr:glycine-rich cell wall structural protein 1.0-like [Setaria italica]XP_034569881.1 glycine-rich cell wall structural protein 1.0-like [Setaria viridis]